MSHYLPALVRFPTSSQCLAHIYFVGFWSPYLIPAGCNRCNTALWSSASTPLAHTGTRYDASSRLFLQWLTGWEAPPRRRLTLSRSPFSLVAPQISIFFFPHIPERKSKDFWKKMDEEYDVIVLGTGLTVREKNIQRVGVICNLLTSRLTLEKTGPNEQG